jgi:phage FluMu protein gp41
MAQVKVTLSKGISIGGITYRDAVLRETTAADVIRATADAERVVMAPNGVDRSGQPVLIPTLVASPTMVGINTLRAQIVSIGPMTAPIDEVIFEKLSPEDLNILQLEAEKLDAASIEVAQRGRTDGDGS